MEWDPGARSNAEPCVGEGQRPPY